MSVRAERGGAAILVAFMLLTLMAGAAFGTSRNLTRELSMCADAARGARAASAAEAGLAWFLAWAAGDPAGLQGVLADAERASGRGGGLALPGPAEGLLDEPDAPLQTRFEVRIQPLGALAPPEAGEEAPPATGAEEDAGRAEESAGRARRLWLVRSVGRCLAGGQDRQGFAQVRELLVASAPAGDPGGLRVLAWRTGLNDQ